MKEATHQFLERFKDYENNSVEVYFGDAFAEFVEILNECDLSEETLDNLNGIFQKDMKVFFKNWRSNK